MSSSSAAGIPARSGTRHRALMLGGSAICCVMIADLAHARTFNVLPTQGAVDLAVAAAGQLNVKTLQAGAVTPGVVTYSSTGAAATVSLSAPRTLIDWTTFQVGAGNSLVFQFSSGASDIVINRVKTGAINVDAGGSVSGTFAGSRAGNIWFLAPNGVFINGTVTASGVLTSNNVGLADLNLLSDNVTALKGEISAAGALIDLTGIETTATGVTVDASGDIVLNGDIDTGDGVVNLLAKGTIAQTSGVITASSLSGSSAGGASLTDANQFDSLSGFTNTGSGDISITDARSTGLLVSGTLTTVPSANLILTASAGPLVLETPVEIGNGGSLVLSAASVLDINAPVFVDGPGSVFLSYNPASAANLSINSNQFDGRIIYRTAGGLAAVSSQGGSLNINDQNYTLLYQLANSGSTGPDTGTNDIAGIDANEAANGDAGFYALATDVFGVGSSSSPQFVSALVGSSGAGFTGTFEGLGNSIITLTIGDVVSGHNVGLFATNSGTIRDLAINNGSVGGGTNSAVGTLVGQNFGSIILAQVDNGVVTDNSGGAAVGGLVGINGANGIIGGSAANGTVNGGVDVGGLVGVNNGQITGSTAKVQITGDANSVDLGGLVGSNTGAVTQSVAAGAVTGGLSTVGVVAVGGLVGSNTGSITQSMAAVAVNGGESAAYTGGLVGYDNGVIDQAAAQSAVTALGGAIGGLIGRRDASSSVSEVYSTGAVTSGAFTTNLGPLVGLDGAGTPITFGYYDTQTSGLSSGVGVGMTTAQLQSAIPKGFNTIGPAWSAGPGLYPYITAVFPAGVQAVSGTVYSDNGSTPMASGANGAIVVHITVNGAENYTPLAGANGYYFGFVGAGRFTSGVGSNVLAWTTANTSVGTVDAASAITATGTTTRLDIYPDVVLLPTTALSLSVLEAADPLNLEQYATTPAFVSTLPIYVRAAGSSFDVDIPLTTGRDVTFQTTTPGAAIRVDAPITLTASSGSLTFLSAGALILNAGLDVPGGAVNLNAGAAITQTGGVITTSRLTGSSTGGASLVDDNLFDLLSGFTNIGPGAVSITDARAGGLIVVGLVDQGVGDALTLTASGGPLTLDGPLVAQGGSINLSAAGSLAINSTITIVGAGAVSLISTPPVLATASFDNGGALTEAGTLTYRDSQGVIATADQGGSLSINDVATPIIYGRTSAVMPIQGSVDLSVATGEGNLGATVLQGGAASPATVGYDSTGTIANINLTAPRTLVDWTTFEVGGGNTLNFNFGGAASDIVINRVATGAITVDAGGAVNGLFQGASGGNVWFLAPGGVFLNGTVTASGVLVGNNVGLADTRLLSDPLGALKGELVAGASLIDLSGSVTATGTAIDALGNILLDGDVDTGSAGTVNLVSTGTVNQSAGVITTGALAGSSVGGASLTDANRLGVLASFSNSNAGRIALVNDISLNVTGAVDNTAGVAGGLARDIAITVTEGDLTGVGVFTAARDVAIAASDGSVSFVSATAGANLVLRVGGALSVTAGLAATGADTGTDAADPTAAGAVLAAARPISLFNAADPALTGGDIDIQAGSVTLSGSTTSGPHGDVRILATSADGPLGPALNVIASISAGADIALDATAAGSIRVSGAQIAGRDVAARSVSGGVTVASVTAGGDIVLASPGGTIVLNGALMSTGSASSGIGQTLFNTVSAPLDGLFTLGRQSIFIDAARYVGGVDPVTGRPSSLMATNAIGLVVADPAGLFLADARPDSGSWAAPASLSAPSISLFESGGNLNVGDASLGGSLTALNLYSGGRVLVTGVIAPSVDDTVNLTIGAGNAVAGQSAWNPSQIEVINDGLTAPDHGAIGWQTVSAAGVYSSTPRTFHAASLYASNDILLGAQDFIIANGSITDLSRLQLIDPNQPVPLVAANTSNAITLAAGDLYLAAGRLIVQQDTAGLMTTSGVGSYITRGLSLDSVGPNPPPAIDLFGVLVAKGSTSLITGMAAAGSGQISLSESLSLSSYRHLYRFNTCVINSISCSGTSTISGIPLDPISQGAPLNLGGGFVDPGDAIGVLGGFGFVSRSSSRPSVAFSWLFVDGFVRYDETEVEDPTVTGAPNEEIWRRPD